MTNTEIWIPSENTLIHANVVRPDQPEFGPGILMIHGWDSDNTGHTERAQRLIGSGVTATILAMDLGGHGRSSVFEKGTNRIIEKEKLTIAGHLQEVKKAHDRLTSLSSVDPERVGVLGASYGGYLAMLLAIDADYDVESLLLRAPAIYPDNQLDIVREKYNTKEIDTFRKDPGAMVDTEFCGRVEDFEGQVWVIESGNDESIPSSVPEFYASKTQNPTHLIIPNAPHSLKSDQHKKQFEAYLRDWAKEL